MILQMFRLMTSFLAIVSLSTGTFILVLKYFYNDIMNNSPSNFEQQFNGSILT
jgi:hypothetical protein